MKLKKILKEQQLGKNVYLVFRSGYPYDADPPPPPIKGAFPIDIKDNIWGININSLNDVLNILIKEDPVDGVRIEKTLPEEQSKYGIKYRIYIQDIESYV